MKALLLVAHGSRLASSNREVIDLASGMAPLSCEFKRVEVAFLELTEPDIPTGIERCVAAGFHSIVVVPYFLAAGTHVMNDIPQIVSQAREKYPNCDFRITEHVGAAVMMPQLIQSVMQSE